MEEIASVLACLMLVGLKLNVTEDVLYFSVWWCQEKERLRLLCCEGDIYWCGV